MPNYVCSNCNKTFSQKSNYERHLKRKFPCSQDSANQMLSINKNSATNSDLKNNSDMKNQIIMLKKRLDEKDRQLEELKETTIELKETTIELKETTIELKKEPRINNQVLQIFCVSNNDNYLDMLTEHWRSFDRALDYIKECALSHLIGDCKLIEKIYLGESNIDPEMNRNSSIRYVDKSRTKIQYFNEKKEKVIDNRESFGRKLANNLQNTYLKGVNYLITKNLEDHRCPNKFLEEYDLQTWNQHIYNLSDSRYQKKIVIQLNIPQ